MISNATRAEWAEQALSTFTNNVNFCRNPAELESGDRADAIADLICDLLHYAVEQGYHPDLLLEQAKMNFEFEQAQAEQQA
ncbi:hypothetical protein KAM448_35080 [Aeromonas caviae]|uniref:NTP pyrophosphohydrolase MazG putative catalytic core domain-containing protein n=2 Tax=Aeromonas TaxID=642 RepID=A0ABD0B7Z9_AERCA|nr:hypothetical protein [Aeromonas caviae]BCK65818.1 hypothetical protein KAM330_48070 [Aeromonas hydrophila]BCR31409.1 hypothetical protein KAM376_44150 [Aeromonas caviae]GJA71831.1 hypothetical protein KAM353_14780 [Aeromonas caviae]GJA81697.1 hypothetical protein KAM355_22570 [Aeromonas caviae]GJB00724.1 hypothetical protein KAM359_41310 [Aeromonas caviae]